jgi:gliding motility-associated-like protein
MKKAPAFLLFFILFLSQQTNAQFFLNQDAIQVSDSCFQLTDEEFNQVGSIWFEEKINLDESFDVLMDLFFGCRDQGADGIVFGLQPVSTSIGQAGGGMGFSGVSPSLAVEFDTWQNPSDPAQDHIAIIKNGELNHSTAAGSLAGPISANANGNNIEDCEYHQMRVTWDVVTLTLTVYFDCIERLSYTGDVVNEIFGGDPEAFWGFTSATGGEFNVQEVCFSYTTFLNGFEDVVICPDGEFQLNLSGGQSYSWSPTEGLSNPNISNPIASPAETTTYIVDVTDECGIPFADTITIFVDGDTVRFALANDTTLCDPQTIILDAENGSPATYLWSDGLTIPVREVDYAGNFQVTVTLDDYCVTQADIQVDYAISPTAVLPEDTTLCLQGSLNLDVTMPFGGADYLWSDGSTNPTLTVLDEGTYSVSVSNFCGEATDEISVVYDKCDGLFIPNAFTPDFDGVNDDFALYSDGDVKQVLQFEIYDRWGELIFSTSGPVNNLRDFKWDGTYRGKIAPAGVYVYVVDVIFKDDSVQLFKGDVTLIR